MIDRYTLPEMAAIWSLEGKFDTWLAVEIAVLAAQEALGTVPHGVTERVKKNATYSIDRIDAIEAEVKHDVIAFLTCLNESVGDDGRYIHLGMTSSDLIDTAFSLQIQRAGALILDKLTILRGTLYARALEHKNTVMIGRSHGIHAEPMTFGLKLLGWVDELDRHHKRLLDALSENRVGQISGPVGTYSNISPDVEEKTCTLLGLNPIKQSTQVISRDIHAQFILALASLASSIEKFVVEIRHLQRTEVLEVEEPFTKGQKGSSAMPHKRNPVSSENLTGLARLVRSYAQPTLENIALWHERDISHSSVERVVFPDACILSHYMLNRFNTVMSGLVVYPENMKQNLSRFGGIVFSQRVLLALTQAGLSREAAYALVQKHAMAAWNTPSGNFKANLEGDPEVTQKLSPEALTACFNEATTLTHIDTIFNRFSV